MNESKWDQVIKPKKSLFSINFKDFFQYSDLLWMFVRKDIIVVYKQTILGPIWFFVQPILTMLTFMVVFGNIANIPTDGIPQPLFYLSGIILWNYFSSCFTKTADTFTQNAAIFGKVYFPRLIQPVSVIISNGIKFVLQFILFLTVYMYFLLGDYHVQPTSYIFFFPLLILLMAIMGLGFGLIFSSMTTKYKDLKFLIQFGVQLLMYATPVIYPLSQIPDKYRTLIEANPISHVIELFKLGFLGEGHFSLLGLLYSISFSIIILVIGILVFNKTERNFMDTV